MTTKAGGGTIYTIGEIGPVEKHNDRHLYTSVVVALS
jgi:hypothetical protein